jgi:hypothetical protein
MKDNNSQRLSTLCRSLNLSSSEVLKRLAEHGFTFDNNPNVKIPKECVDLLTKDDKAFSENDKNQKTIDIEAIAKVADIEEKQHTKRLSLICKELNISFSFIQQSLKNFGIEVSNLNQRVDTKTEKLILEIVSGNTQANLSQLNSEKKSKQDLPVEFLVPNPFEKDVIKLNESLDRFNERPQRVISKENKSIETVFSDFEAFSICLGLEDRHYKHIAREYFKNPKIDINVLEAHDIAMKALEKYGSELLSFVISLPALPFKAFDATQIFAAMDKRSNFQDFPILRIVYKNDSGHNEKIQIAFFAFNENNKRIKHSDVLTIKNNTTGQTLMRITRDGRVCPENNAKQIIPIIQLFHRFSKDTKSAILNYGLETGECSICGRELTDALSLKRGIGPICYERTL